MTDREMMEGVFKGNRSAIDLVVKLVNIADVWDNLIDRDVELDPRAIHSAFMDALFGLRANTFYREHEAILNPLMMMAVLNWRISTDMQNSPGMDREIAHADRYRLSDVAIMIAMLTGGMDHALEHGPAIKRAMQKEDFTTFNAEMEAADERPRQ
jgi:hypothetical protein